MLRLHQIHLRLLLRQILIMNDLRDLNSWLKNLSGAAQSFVNSLQGLFGASSSRRHARASLKTFRDLLTPNAATTFDSSTQLGTLNTSTLGSAPASGIIQVRFKAKNRAKAKDFVLNVPANTLGSDVVKGQAPVVQFVLDAGTLKRIADGKSSKIFFSTKFTPLNGDKAVQKRYKFNLAKRK
jgi:hypothetical protein